MKSRLLVAMAAAILCLFASFPSQAREKAIPKTADKFTAYMADRFSDALPSVKASIKGPLELEVVSPKGRQQVFLNRVWDFCERDRRNCRKEVDSFLANMPSVVLETTDDSKPSDIRVVVRPSAYVEQLRKLGADRADYKGVFRPFAGDLWMICVLDMPHGVATLNQAGLAKLHLTEDEAFALGLKNLTATLAPLAEHSHEPKNSPINFATGDFYESSRMLLHDSWSGLAKAMGGHLIVAVPSSDVLVYGDGTAQLNRTALGGLVHEIVGKAPKPISSDLYEWTPTGWTVANP